MGDGWWWRSRGRGEGVRYFCVHKFFFVEREGGGRRGSSLGREKFGRENKVCEADILCT